MKNEMNFPKREIDSRTSVNSRTSSILSSCRICLSSLLDPASLTCGHRFCEYCLQRYWHVMEKPDSIICPLCRASALSINFCKNEDKPSTDDFRKIFKIMDDITTRESTVNDSTLIYVEISILMSCIYLILKFLKVPAINLLTLLKFKLSTKLSWKLANHVCPYVQVIDKLK